MTPRPQTWTLVLPWPDMPLSMNDRLHWRAEATVVDQIKTATRLLARQAHIPRLVHAEVTLIWTVPDQRIRDEENPVATLKACCDGLKDETLKGVRMLGVVPDDSPKWMTKHMPVIEYRRGCRSVRLVITGRIDQAKGRAA